MTNQYPFQKLFESHLKKKDLSEVTIKDYSATLSDLFNYLSNFNLCYQRNHQVSEIFDRDIIQYLQMIVEKRNNANNTYNKVLSQINGYFKFLFQSDLNTHLPTLNIPEKEKKENLAYSTKWLYKLDSLLNDDSLNFYSRMVLLLTSKGFAAKEFLRPGFYKQLNQIYFSEPEKLFLNNFQRFIEPLQSRSGSPDLFLKSRLNNDPHLSMSGLHKYLKPDSKYLGINLNPSVLYRAYVLTYLNDHLDLSNQELMANLRLDPASLNYYQKLQSKN